MDNVQLLRPSLEHLPDYVAALERGWSPDNIRGAEAAREQLEKIAVDAAAFVASLEDVEAKGGDVRLPDGSLVPRLPGYYRWIWDGEFCGSIGFRWQNGTSQLPPHVLGHIGFAVVPWKRGRGCARQALKLLLPEARQRGLDYVEITTDPDNIASQRVIMACGGLLVERFRRTEAFGGTESLRYRIDLAEFDEPKK
jgi:predicted acetyltransferase